MDIQTLSRNKQNPQQLQATKQTATIPVPNRRWKTRIALPLIILFATLALVGYAARDLLRPGIPVQITRAIPVSSPAVTGENSTSKTTTSSTIVVAQAPGWVEPDPYPIFVTALTDGVIETVNVLEGETVKKGQTLVQLVNDDAKLSLKQAQAELQKRQAILTAAQTDLNEPIALQRAAAVTQANLAQTKASLVRLDAEIAKEEAKLAELEAAYKRLTEISQASVSALKVDAAKYQVQSQQAVVTATKQRLPELQAAQSAAEAEYQAAKRDLELKTTLIRNRDEAAAAVEEAKVTVAEAELRLQRMTLKSPVDGVVMARLTAPGDKLMLGMDDMHSAHAIHLYNPASLQVRVDVPLADAASVGVAQQAEIIVDVLPDKIFKGEVTRVVHRADLAKNTVQFKVAIKNPSPVLKPEMLARVKFFSPSGNTGITNNNTGTETSSSITTVAIKQTAIITTENESFVWWVDPETQNLVRRKITLGRNHDDGMVIILNGLNPGDMLVNNPSTSLTEGQHVQVLDKL